MKTRRLALYNGIAAILAIGAWAFFHFFVLPQRRDNEDRSVRLWQIRAAAEQYFVENPERVFVGYEDILGPGGTLGALKPVNREDYRHLFPLRVDIGLLSVTMEDGRQVIAMPDGAMIQRAPDGRLRGAPAAIGRYNEWTAKANIDGVHVLMLPGGARLETTYKNGQPDGPFRAYRKDGTLWATADYANDRLAGNPPVQPGGK